MSLKCCVEAYVLQCYDVCQDCMLEGDIVLQVVELLDAFVERHNSWIHVQFSSEIRHSIQHIVDVYSNGLGNDTCRALESSLPQATVTSDSKQNTLLQKKSCHRRTFATSASLEKDICVAGRCCLLTIAASSVGQVPYSL